MIDEGELRRTHPDMAWDQPVQVHVLVSKDTTIRREDERTVIVANDSPHFYGWACRYCIAIYGLKADDLMNGRLPDRVFDNRADALDHIDATHHD